MKFLNVGKLSRYLPLAAVVAVQILIIGIAPSKSPQEAGQLAGGPGGTSNTFIGDDTSSPDFIDDDISADPTTGGAPGARGARGGRTGRGGTGGGGGGGSDAGPAGPPGSTEHCVNGRQFDPQFFAYAPPCVPVFGGNNGGDTYRGATAEKVKVVVYDADLGQAVEALLEAQGSNPTPAQLQDFQKAASAFINKNFELYGRQIELKYWRGQCQAVPPDYPCLRNEMRRIVQDEEPFWVVWNTSLASPAFDELSQLKAMNSGGWGFRDSFNQQRRPYHWDLLMGGTNQMRQTAEWWCKRMNGGKARYAGETGTDPERQNPPSNDIRNKNRVLGVISTDDPENKLAVAEFKRFIGDMCGASVAHEYYYAQDITTAEQQRREAVTAMRQPPESTTIICFCDLVAPIFLYQTCQEQQYFPEHVIAGTGFMDADAAAQAYDNTLPPPGHQFENAFGLAQQAKAQHFEGNSSARVYQSEGGTGAAYQSAEADWNYYAMVAGLIQMAGPNLNPQTVEANASKLSFQPSGLQDEFAGQRSFNPAAGDYTWIDTMREVYWSTEKTSPFNNEQGTYITLHLGGKVWFGPGQYPQGMLSEIPPKPR